MSLPSSSKNALDMATGFLLHLVWGIKHLADDLCLRPAGLPAYLPLIVQQGVCINCCFFYATFLRPFSATQIAACTCCVPAVDRQCVSLFNKRILGICRCARVGEPSFLKPNAHYPHINCDAPILMINFTHQIDVESIRCAPPSHCHQRRFAAWRSSLWGSGLFVSDYRPCVAGRLAKQNQNCLSRLWQRCDTNGLS